MTNSFASLAREAAIEAGALLLDYHERGFEVHHKGEIDLVTDADRAAQDAILKKIRGRHPSHSFLGEEGLEIAGDPAYRWIIDPLDGTTNFVHGYPKFAVSIALEINGELSVGCVYDPCLKELFEGEIGKGATLNRKPIRVSKEHDLRRAFGTTGFPYDQKNPSISNLPCFNHMIYRMQAIRRDGSAALNLSYVACGRFDLFWEMNLSPWDIAAGMLFVTEAGGKLTTIDGAPFSVMDRHLAATNGLLHDSLIRELRSVSHA